MPSTHIGNFERRDNLDSSQLGATRDVSREKQRVGNENAPRDKAD